MTLGQWLSRQGAGAMHRLMFRTGLSYPTIRRAREGRATLASAQRIHRATGREVSIASMTSETNATKRTTPRSRGSLA